jgi:hypothetical protein
MGALGEDGHVMQSHVSGFEPPAGLLAVGATFTALPVVAAARSQAAPTAGAWSAVDLAVFGGPRLRGPKALGSVRACVADRALPGVPVVQPEHAR